MLLFPICCLCNLKCYTHKTHHPNYIYYTLLVANLIDSIHKDSKTHPNHTDQPLFHRKTTWLLKQGLRVEWGPSGTITDLRGLDTHISSR